MHNLWYLHNQTQVRVNEGIAYASIWQQNRLALDREHQRVAAATVFESICVRGDTKTD